MLEALQCWDASPLLEGKGVSDEHEPTLEPTGRRGLPATWSAQIHSFDPRNHRKERGGFRSVSRWTRCFFFSLTILCVTKFICFPLNSRFLFTWASLDASFFPHDFSSQCVFFCSPESLSLYHSELRVLVLCHRDMLSVGLPWIQDSFHVTEKMGSDDRKLGHTLMGLKERPWCHHGECSFYQPTVAEQFLLKTRTFSRICLCRRSSNVICLYCSVLAL